MITMVLLLLLRNLWCNQLLIMIFEPLGGEFRRLDILLFGQILESGIHCKPIRRFVVQEQLFRAVAAVLHWFIVNRHSGIHRIDKPDRAYPPYDDDKNDLLFLAEPLKIKEASPLCKFKQISSFFYPLTRGWRAQGRDS